MSNITAVQTGAGWDVDGPTTTQVLVNLDTNGAPTGSLITPDGQPVGGCVVVTLTDQMSPEAVNSAIESALTFRGHVLVQGRGVFELDGPIVVDEFTTLEVAQGCTLKWPANYPAQNTAQRAMIENRSKTATRHNVTVTASANVATISWPSHGCEVGDAVMIMGSATRGYNGAYLVQTVIDSNTITVALDAVPDATPAVPNTYFTSVQACRADQEVNIIINGCLDGNGVNNPVVNNTPVMGVILSCVFNCWVRGSGALVDMQGYTATVAGGSHCGFDCESIYINNPRRDGFHMQGPIRHGVIRGARGYSYDDFTSLTTGDYAQYNEMTEGEFEDILVADISCTCPATGSGAAQFGKSRWWFSDIRYSNIRGKMAGSLLHLKRLASADRYSLDKPVYVGPLLVDDMRVENLNGSVNYVTLFQCTGDPTLKQVSLARVGIDGLSEANGCRLVTFNRTASDWSVDTLDIDGFTSNNQGTQGYISGASGISIGTLSIRNSTPYVRDYGTAFSAAGMTIGALSLSNVYADMGAGSTLLALGSGTVARVTVTNCPAQRYRTANSGQLIYSNGAVLREVLIADTQWAGVALVWGDTAMNNSAGHRIKLRGNFLHELTKAVILNKACTIQSSGNTELNASTVFELRGAAQVYNFLEDIVDSASTAPFSFAGGATVNIYAPGRRLDVTTVGVNRVDGGSVWNTNASAGTLGTGPAVCVGTAANSWKRVGNYGLTY